MPVSVEVNSPIATSRKNIFRGRVLCGFGAEVSAVTDKGCGSDFPGAALSGCGSFLT